MKGEMVPKTTFPALGVCSVLFLTKEHSLSLMVLSQSKCKNQKLCPTLCSAEGSRAVKLSPCQESNRPSLRLNVKDTGRREDPEG